MENLKKIISGNRKIIILLAAIVLLGAFVRFYNLGKVSFVADEFLDINATYGYAQTGEWQAWDFNLKQPAERMNVASDERAWLYRWQVAQVFKFLPPTEAAARAVSALWGIITTVLMYFVAKYFSGKKEIGLLAAFLFAVSIVGIEFDRRLRMYAMLFPVYLTFSWLLFRFLEEKYAGGIKIFQKISEKIGVNLVYIVPVVGLGLLSLHLHQITANIAIILATYAGVHIFLERKSIYFNIYLNKYSYIVGIMLAGIVGGKIIFPQILERVLGTLKFFQDNYSYFGKVLVDYSHPLIALIFFGLGICYLYKILKKQKEVIWLAVSFLVPLFLAVFFWRRNAGPQYIFFAQSFEMILIAAGIFGVAEFLREKLPQYKNKAFFVPLVLMLLVLPNYGYFFAENNVYRQNSLSENPNYRSVFEYFKKNRLPEDVLITRDFRNYYWSGEGVKTYDFGGEVANDKLTLDDVLEITANHSSGWVIFADNDESYIANEARDYIAANMEKINAIAVRGKVSVYRWK